MKTLRTLTVSLLFLLGAVAVLAQATIPVTGQKTTTNVGTQLLTGNLVFTVTDTDDTPVTYTPLGGSPTTATITIPVINGAVQNIGGFPPQIPNPVTMSPSNTRYRIEGQTTDGSITYYTLPLTQIDAPSWTFDGYSVPSTVIATGLSRPQLVCQPGAQYGQTDVSLPYNWVCSALRADGSVYWTQNPVISQNLCPNSAMAYVSPRSVAAPFCVDWIQAYVTPGKIIGRAGLPGPWQILDNDGGSICGTDFIPCLNTPNVWLTGIQRFKSSSPTDTPVVVQGFGGGFATPQYVQGTATQVAGEPFFGCSVELTGVAAGDAILMMGYPPHGAQSTVDSQGNTYALVGMDTTVGSRQLAVFLATNVSAGTDTITMNGTQEVAGCLALEYSGIAPDGAIDASIVTGGATTATSFPVGPVTTTLPNDVLITVLLGGNEPTPSSGYTLNWDSGDIYVASQFASAPGSYSSTWTSPGSTPGNGWSVALIALKARGAMGQSSDLTQWQDFDGTVLSRVNNNGQFVFPSTAGCPTNTPLAGATAYDSTANEPCFYNGTSWVHFGSGGGITLTTTGSSGAATLTGSVLNIPIYSGISSPLTTKGDIFGFNTANARIPVGADHLVLTADSTNALGVSWQTAGTGTLTGSGVATFFSCWTATTALGDCPMSFGGSPQTITATARLAIISGGTDSTQIDLTPTAHATTVTSGAASWGTDTVTTAGVYLMPQAPGSGLWLGTNASGKVTDTFLAEIDGDCVVGVSGVWAAATCPGGGGNTTSTSLTNNFLPKANGANSIVNSLLSDNGTRLLYPGTGGMLLGVAGSLGGFECFAGTTSGSLCLQPAGGALGSAVQTLQAVTDTIVDRATTDTLTNKTISGSSNTLSNIANGSLVNASMAINGTTCTLGGSCSPSASAPLYLSWTFNSGAAATDASPRFLASHAATIATCYALTTASDGSTALTFNIFDNGSSIFSGGAQTISAGTSAGTLTTLGSLGTTSIANNDKFGVNITSGTSSWVFTVQCK